jgi:rod shape determining protein RodA
MAIALKGIRLSVFLTILVFLTGTILLSWTFLLKPYQKDRLTSFLNPEKYSQTTGYQVIQSKIAIGAGELTGQGYLKGSQAQMKFLPARHTDFILSVLGEEFGFLGISMLLFLFFIFFYRQFTIKVNNDEDFYFIYLFNGFILFQFIINVLMSIGFFPIMGVPLPFISYGGSSLITFFIAEAIIFRMKLDYFST